MRILLQHANIHTYIYTYTYTYIYILNFSNIFFVALYVDDGLVAYENEDDFAKLVADMKSDFQITVSPASCFLELQIKRQTDGSVLVTQTSYTKKILEKFNIYIYVYVYVYMYVCMFACCSKILSLAVIQT